jgi:chemotaxis protein histidine kinase CheA
MASYWNVKLTSGAQLNCSRGKDGVYLGGFDANNAPDLLFTVDFDDAANGWVRLVNPKSYRLTSPIYIYLGNADNNASKFKIQVKDNDLQKYSQMRDKTIANGIAYGNNNIAKNVISTTKTTSKKSTKDTFNTKKNKTKKKTNKVKKKTDKIKKIKNSSISSKFDKNLKKYANSAKYAQIIKNGHRIFGAPYRFMSHVDYQPQIDGVGNVGREYMDNILLEAPIVHFVPGLPAYLTDFTKRDKETLEQYMATQTKSDADGGVSNNVLKKITDMEGRYFNFSPNYAEYIRYVNLLCSSCAIFMGLGNTIVPGTKGKNGEGGIKYPDFNWANYENIKPIGKKEIIQKAKAAKKDTDNKKKKNSKKSKKTTKKNTKKTTKNPNNKKAKPKTKPKAKPPKSTLKDNMFAATAKKIYKDLFGDYHFLKL